ncbi:hypothetical protein [Thalassospira sp.]|uniref:hypothetical protein n=1 Tax=Thalassospira sp. TaxID=1912094 RepID=UPI001B141DD9|nr:hypothetical protein [Thalassospira sp.]MBO6808421.1 hypothetical protein [Thalassospira sp.]MBO6839881.1 hypothetical protein [Thalassospira sp.]
MLDFLIFVGALFLFAGLVVVIKPPKKLTRKTGLIYLVIGASLGLGAVALSDSSESDAEIAHAKADREEEERKGFHCLSAWDGSYPDLERYVEDHLVDPDSYEHIETLISPVSDIGTHDVSMQFRARNGFGGMTIGSASAVITQEDCKIVTASIDQN